MSGVFDDIRKTETPVKPIQGIIWINMLVEFDTNGHAKILQSFSNPAKDSTIKRLKKVKKIKKEKIKISEEVKQKDLF